MSTMTSQTACDSNVYQQLVQANNEHHIKAARCWPFVRGIHPDRWSPFINGSVMLKGLSSHDVFMTPVLLKDGVVWRADGGNTYDYQFCGSQYLRYWDHWHYVISLLDAMLSMNPMSISYSLLFSMHIHLWPICNIIGYICCTFLLCHIWSSRITYLRSHTTYIYIYIYKVGHFVINMPWSLSS